MNVEFLDLKEILSSKIIDNNNVFEKSPISLYLTNNIPLIKHGQDTDEISECLYLLNELLSKDKDVLNEEVAQSLLSLFSIDKALKGQYSDSSLYFQKAIFNNPDLTFSLLENLFKYSEKHMENGLLLDKKLAEFVVKLEMEEPTIKTTKFLSSSYRAIKNRSELETYLITGNKDTILQKLENDGVLFLNRDKQLNTDDLVITWKEDSNKVGTLLEVEQNADIKVLSKKTLTVSNREDEENLFNEYLKDNNLKLMTSVEKMQYISVGKNSEMFKGNIVSQSVVSFDDKGEIQEILFNYSPITKSIVILQKENELKIEKATESALKLLESKGVDKIELIEKNSNLNSKIKLKILRKMLIKSRLKEGNNIDSRQIKKRNGSF